MNDEVFKPDFDGPRGSPRLSGPERQQLRLGKAGLIGRIHDAMLTLGVLGSTGPQQMGSGAPTYLVEFSDRVGEEQQEVPPARFKPTAAQVSDMHKALALLDGLRKPYFKVVMLRAIHEFARSNGEQGDWPWKKIGGVFGLSERWAESAYDTAIIQAARRSGLLPAVSTDYGILAVGVWVGRAWMTNISTASDPRQAVANLKVKSPLRLETAFTVWVAGQPVAKRVVDQVKPGLRNLLSHGSWYKVHPDSVADLLVQAARDINADWLIEDIAVKGALAA